MKYLIPLITAALLAGCASPPHVDPTSGPMVSIQVVDKTGGSRRDAITIRYAYADCNLLIGKDCYASDIYTGKRDGGQGPVVRRVPAADGRPAMLSAMISVGDRHCAYHYKFRPVPDGVYLVEAATGSSGIFPFSTTSCYSRFMDMTDPANPKPVELLSCLPPLCK
ncbi:hypothetical protein [Chitinimonas naiadis]